MSSLKIWTRARFWSRGDLSAFKRVDVRGALRGLKGVLINEGRLQRPAGGQKRRALRGALRARGGGGDCYATVQLPFIERVLF